MVTTFSNILEEMEKLRKSIEESKEQTLAEIITKYDFAVGSKELKGKLTETLPKAAKIIYSPFIEDPTVIYAIKKFEISSLFSTPYKPESEEPKTDALNKIKAEIKELQLIGYATIDGRREIASRAVMQVIDKYKESEKPNENNND